MIPLILPLAPPAVIRISLDPVFNLGPLPIHWYGVCYAVAFLVGLRIALPHAERHGIPQAVAGRTAFWCIVLGLIGGRLFYDLQSGALHYLTHPLQIFAFWQGGMAFFGAIFLGIATLAWCSRHYRVSFWVLLDAGVLFAAIGQPIGRIGNIINGDILGGRSSLPWATAYTNPHTYAPQLGVAYQPVAAYEALMTLVMLGILLLLRRRGVAAGVLGIVYLILYPVSQFGIFFLRNPVNVPYIALGLKQTQWTSIGVLLLGVPLVVAAWLWSRRHPGRFPDDAGGAQQPTDNEGARPAEPPTTAPA
ncbi:MAG TPA: prolipoprotein diacylglyceryl transferase [Verrucomicrobiae bacterium]|nr:prolipoprotein diacylglyceryl transferase [Verrucomicrobiae bacterium]